MPRGIVQLDEPAFGYEPGLFLEAHDLVRDAHRSFRLDHRFVPIKGSPLIIPSQFATGEHTSPTIASLAARILNIPKEQRTKWVLAQAPEELAKMLVTLAGTGLTQARDQPRGPHAPKPGDEPMSEEDHGDE